MALSGYTREELELRRERLRKEKKELQQKGGILATLKISKINFDIDETENALDKYKLWDAIEDAASSNPSIATFYIKKK